MKKIYRLLCLSLSIISITSCKNNNIDYKSEKVPKSNIISKDIESEDKIGVSVNSLTSILLTSHLKNEDDIDISLDDKNESMNNLKNEKSAVSFLTLDEALKLNSEDSNFKISMITTCNNLYALSKSKINSFKDIRNKSIYFGESDRALKSLFEDKIDAFGPLLSIDTVNIENYDKVFEKLKDENSIVILPEPYKTKADGKINFSINIEDLIKTYLKEDNLQYISEVMVVNEKLINDDQLNKLINNINTRDRSESYDIIKKNYNLSDKEIEKINDNLDFTNLKSSQMKDLVKKNVSILYKDISIDDKLFYNLN